MSVRNDKEKIIREIMNLRIMINAIKLSRNSNQGLIDTNLKEEMNRQLNKIHDMVFNI